MKEETFSSIVKRKASKANIDTINIQSDYYTHPTYVINNLSEYIDLISIISSANQTIMEGDTVVYRGVADEKYELIPGLARLGNVYDETEEKIINEFITRRPDAFAGLSDFDTLAKMQHYGLPTRLLDYSSNPLIALFFACESLPGKDGRVICNNSFIDNDSSIYVKAICNAAINKMFDGHYTVEEYLCNEQLTIKKYLSFTYSFRETTVIRPKYWNQRIANQAGVFMLFPNAAVDRYRTILLYAGEMGIEEAINQYGRGKIDKAKIEKALTVEPIDYYRNMDNSVVTEDSFQMMKNAYKDDKEYTEMIKNRFRVASLLNCFSKSQMLNNCCSIIIEGKNKKKILKELAYMGIGIDFIYPELEYTAKEIKRNIEKRPYDPSGYWLH